MTEGPVSCEEAELRTLFLFEKLDQDQLARLCRDGHVAWFQPGPVYREGEPATALYVLFEGTVILSRQVRGQDVEVQRSSARGAYAGAFHAYVGDRAPQVYTNSMRVTEPSRFFVLPADTFAQVMHEWFPMAVHLLEGLFFGARTTQEAIGQRERLLALGSLTAGLTHELNNPAAAAVRATSALREAIGRTHVGEGDSGLTAIRDDAMARARTAPSLPPLDAADAEDAVTDWLEEHDVTDAWRLAPVLVQAGLDVAWLDRTATMLAQGQFAASPAETTLDGAVRHLAGAVETELLLKEIEDATGRVSALVGAARQYTQLDRAPFQHTDVHELLDSTLVMLSKALGPQITVVRDYDRSLPQIPAYPGELNQVWTNLIDNAAWAIRSTGQDGTVTVRTARDGGRLLVEIGDTGPGVPAEIRERLFDPFFTTKPVGEGTGLGLDVSWRVVVNRHGGDLRFESKPGDTRFQVRLPINPEEEPA